MLGNEKTEKATNLEELFAEHDEAVAHCKSMVIVYDSAKDMFGLMRGYNRYLSNDELVKLIDKIREGYGYAATPKN